MNIRNDLTISSRAARREQRLNILRTNNRFVRPLCATGDRQILWVQGRGICLPTILHEGRQALMLDRVFHARGFSPDRYEWSITLCGSFSVSRPIEQVAGDVGLTMYDEQSAKRLAVEQPDLMPYYPKDKALKRGIDLTWGKRQITAQVTQGILTGETVKQMSDRLQSSITGMNRASAIRAARTAVTGAENSGRMDSYDTAEKMGIKVKKQWVATIDGRTRHSHALLDGVSISNDRKFDNGCRFPGDPAGPAWEVYNCRCTLIADVSDFRDGNTLRRGRDGLMPDVTYAQWETSKRGYNASPVSVIHNSDMIDWRKSLQNQENTATLKAKISSSEISTKLSHQQYAKHVPGTPQFEQYKNSRLEKGGTPQSVLFLSEDQAQNIINRYSCSGTIQITSGGKIVEYCPTDTEVGQYFANNAYHNTRRVEIFYGKRGAHVVPVAEAYDD